ncbi:MAG: SpoIID/LytB domain-containing protein [Acutalibacteraceae bacterium]
MIKLLSLEGFLSLSSDAVKKIEDVLRPIGLEKTEKYDDVDDFIDAVIENIDDGSDIILAAENEEYNSVKKQLIDTFSLRKHQSSSVQEAIIESRNGLSSVRDIDGHCLMPLDADIYISDDGMYSGFCVEFSNGSRMIYVPLDDSRLDTILEYVKKEFVKEEPEAEEENSETPQTGAFSPIKNEGEAEFSENEGAKEPEYNDPETDLGEETTADGEAEPEYTEGAAQEQENAEESEASAQEVYSGMSDKASEEENATLTLKSGEELIIDDSADEADLTGFEEAMSAAAKTAFSLINLDKSVAFVGGATSPFLLAMCNEVDGLSDTFKVCEPELENEEEMELQVALAKKTRLAIRETGASFGAAISTVQKGEKDGKEIYYSYIIIHDGASAKAKKVSTATKQGIESLIPHAFAVMFGLIERKAESIAQLESDSYDDEDSDKKKKTAVLAVCIAAAAVAIVSAIVMVWSYFQKTPELLTTTSTPSPEPSSSTSQPQSSLTPPSSDPLLSTGIPGFSTTDPNYPYPAEPTAGDLSNTPTSTPFSSTKGMFTFTVYGYGHGVGMSQTGADYYASIGKTYLEILAMYYYGAQLVLGDTAPETVKFGNSSFPLRDYLATAVESEMGGSYNPEALKAQAVAVYTFAKYYNFDVPATLHAFSKTPTQASYDAVDTVLGQYMIYNGEVIRPYFHATSAGKTTSYANAFGDGQLPYLSGGRPSYGDVNAKDYCTTVSLSSDEINALIYSKTGKTLTGDPANWFKILSHDGCISDSIGYVSKIQVGDEVYSGYDFRMKVLGGAIRSHCFTFIYTPTA